MPKQAKYETFYNTRKKLYYFHLKAPNGQIIHPSETYPTYQAMMKGLKSCQKYSGVNTLVVDGALEAHQAAKKAAREEKKKQKAS